MPIIKKKLFFSFYCIVYITFLCSFANNNTYQTQCVSLDTDGYTILKIWDTQKGAKYKPELARQDAIRAILFSGVSGGNNCTTQPPILRNDEDRDNFKKIQRGFFSKKGKWSMFTRSSATETTLPEVIGSKNWKVYQVSVSKKELRKYLEDEKIINSLNNGF